MTTRISRRLKGTALRLSPLTLLIPILLVGTAAAAGSGYNLSFTRVAGSIAIGSIDLVSVSTNDPGGANITVTYQVNGQIDLTHSTTGYFVYFGGSGTSSATAYVTATNNTTAASFIATAGGFSSGYVQLTSGNGGSSESFSIAKSVVGPSSGFTVNVYAWSGSPSGASYSWLGSDYPNGGGTGTCTTTGCTSTATAGALLAGALLYAVIGIVVLVAVVVAVVVVVMRRRKPPMAAPMPPGVPMPPPPQPPMPPS